MSVYMTEDEQLEAIKSWWKRYNGIVIIIFSLLLLSISGYKYWYWHHEKIARQASNTYEQLMAAFANKDETRVVSYANQLSAEYKKTIYADVARLVLARMDVTHGNYKHAQQELNDVVTHSKMTALRQIANIRAARLLMAEHSFDKALAQLEPVFDEEYLPLVNEVKGDINAASGHYRESMSFYRKALQGMQDKGINNLFLEMKMTELQAFIKPNRTHTS
jgi:predicted negative regulator of RcsB-dependent stress response